MQYVRSVVDETSKIASTYGDKIGKNKCFFSNSSCNIRWEVIIRFVNIGAIVGHHCLNFLFIMVERDELESCKPIFIKMKDIR
jgi:hypothetical protein